MKNPLVIAIDGPSGSGKSSTARGVAQRLGLSYLDTGSMYRAVTWAYLDAGIPDDDTDAITELTREADIEVGTNPASPQIWINGIRVTSLIREPRISAKASVVATNLKIRALLTEQMRAIIEESSRKIVVEGRDITTVVWPDADVRVLLVADSGARIARRHAELGESVDAAAVTDQVVRRDRDDSTVSEFHTPAPGVTLVDSTDLSLDEVIDVIAKLAEDR
ncbi:MAG TPA: (d)CMP kinase [Propionibacteriaceae bacterium]|nr:(d)CMP kinase [Propionibacteriaceae bacterium]